MSAWEIDSEGGFIDSDESRVILGWYEVISLNPNELKLYCHLLLHHGEQRNKRFAIANAMAKTIGFGVKRFAEARDGLMKKGLIQCVRSGGHGPHTPGIYRLAREYSPEYQTETGRQKARDQ